jgi:hypothetical protein
MDRQSLVSKLLLGVAALGVAIPMFWLAGGIGWLDTHVFPPRRPKNMPENAIWIDAPALPISWHHGWWFGCDIASSGMANYCRLVTASGEEVYAGEYLACSLKSAMRVSDMKLVPPPAYVGMWIADERLTELAPIGALRNGDLLLPVVTLDRCDKFKSTHR